MSTDNMPSWFLFAIEYGYKTRLLFINKQIRSSKL